MKCKIKHPFCDICGNIKDECSCIERLVRISGLLSRLHKVDTKKAREKYELLMN